MSDERRIQGVQDSSNPWFLSLNPSGEEPKIFVGMKWERYADGEIG